MSRLDGFKRDAATIGAEVVGASPPGICGQIAPGPPWMLLIWLTSDMLSRLCDLHFLTKHMDSPRHELERLLEIESAAKAANLIGPDGKVRRVLGTLPVTADGCIVGEGAEPLYWVCPTTRRVRSSGTGRVLVDYGEVVPVEYVATTPEAAEAAKENRNETR